MPKKKDSTSLTSSYTDFLKAHPEPLGDAGKLFTYLLFSCPPKAGERFCYTLDSTMMGAMGWRSLDRVDAALAELRSRGFISDRHTQARAQGDEVEGFTLYPSGNAPAHSTAPTIEPAPQEPAQTTTAEPVTEEDIDWGMVIGPVRKKEEPKNEPVRASPTLAELEALHAKIIGPELEHERRMQEDPEYRANYNVRTFEAQLKQKRRSGTVPGAATA